VEAGTSAFPTPNNDGDLPVSDVVRDDSSKTLYVSTDFGVLRGDNDGTGGWHVTDGMPRYEVMHLEIQPSSRVASCAVGKKCKPVMYAATHSQGIWQGGRAGRRWGALRRSVRSRKVGGDKHTRWRRWRSTLGR
jgi:hypothetical protein